MRRPLVQTFFAAVGLAVVFSATPAASTQDSCGETFAPGVTCSQSNCEPWCDEPGCTSAQSGHDQNEQGCWCECVPVP
jgi:hypothetical protein